MEAMQAETSDSDAGVNESPRISEYLAAEVRRFDKHLLSAKSNYTIKPMSMLRFSEFPEDDPYWPWITVIAFALFLIFAVHSLRLMICSNSRLEGPKSFASYIPYSGLDRLTC